MDPAPLIVPSAYDSSNQPQPQSQDLSTDIYNNSSNKSTIPAPQSSLGPNTTSSSAATVPTTLPSTSMNNTASMPSHSAQEYGIKLDQLDPSVAAAVAASWSTRQFSGVELPIGLEQPSPEQLIQQQMLSQSRSLLMQNMAARDIETTNSNGILRTFTGKHAKVMP